MTANDFRRLEQSELDEIMAGIGRRARSLRQQRLFRLALICIAVVTTSIVVITMIVVLTVHVVEEVLR